MRRVHGEGRRAMTRSWCLCRGRGSWERATSAVDRRSRIEKFRRRGGRCRRLVRRGSGGGGSRRGADGGECGLLWLLRRRRFARRTRGEGGGSLRAWRGAKIA